MFRFTIREIVLLTVIVAMGISSWIDRRAYVHAFNEATLQKIFAVNARDDLEKLIEAQGYDVYFTSSQTWSIFPRRKHGLVESGGQTP